jgi:hypothetical protein
MGNLYGKKTEAAKRKADRYYPYRGQVLHIFADRVDLTAVPGRYTGYSPRAKSDLLHQRRDYGGVPVETYDFILGDPYYTGEDAEHVGQGMVNRNAVFTELQERMKLRARIVWLDQTRPMYSAAVLKCEAVIGIVGSTDHSFRVLSVFRKIAEPEPKAATKVRRRRSITLTHSELTAAPAQRMNSERPRHRSRGILRSSGSHRHAPRSVRR